VGAKPYLKLRAGFPKSLADQPFIVPTADSRVRHEFESFCKHVGIRPDYLAETQDVMVQKLLAQSEIGMTVIPKFAAREFLDHKELFLIGKLPRVYEELFLVSASRKIENPVASFLMKHFKVE
jgi:LysR family transcriptional activator of nhaA